LNRKLLATSELLVKFREVAKRKIDNLEITNVALNVLANLAHGANATRAGLKDNGIIDFLNEVMVKNHANAELVHDAYEIAHIIPHEGEVEEETSSESQSESEEEDYSGDDDVSKYINELKENDTQGVSMESLKQTQKLQEQEIAQLKKQIEEKEEAHRRYEKKIAELSKEVEQQYDTSRETLSMQSSNAEIRQDLEEKRNRTLNMGRAIDSSSDLYEEGTNKYLKLLAQEEEETKRAEATVNELKEKIEAKKNKIKEQEESIHKYSLASKRLAEAEELFEETKSHLLMWIQLAIKLEGMPMGRDGQMDVDRETLNRKVMETFNATAMNGDKI
jgi:DNA repair exonuclease SbcCD ATPase subunit